MKCNDGSHDHDSHNGSSHDDIELEGVRGKDSGMCLVISEGSSNRKGCGMSSRTEAQGIGD